MRLTKEVQVTVVLIIIKLFDSNQMEKNINPWTGKSKTSKNVGLFNQILYKYYPEMERAPQPNPYLEMITLIQTQTNSKNIDQYLELFDLKSKIKKIDEISEWINKIQTAQKNPIEKQMPINSSFIYLPVYAYNTFHQIMKDCSSVSKEPILGEEVVTNIKNQLKEMEKVLELNDRLVNAIL